MSTLELGVKDIAYTDGANAGVTTTWQVAEILEEKYAVMETFWEIYKDVGMEEIAQHYMHEMNDALDGHKSRKKKFDMPKLKLAFSRYLGNDEWQKTFGYQIKAAINGETSRKKSKKYSGPRPAFIDTGMYRDSFRARLVE